MILQVTTIENDSIKLQKNLDLNGYSLKNLNPPRKYFIYGKLVKNNHFEFNGSPFLFFPFKANVIGIKLFITDITPDSNVNFLLDGLRFAVKPPIRKNAKGDWIFDTTGVGSINFTSSSRSVLKSFTAIVVNEGDFAILKFSPF